LWDPSDQSGISMTCDGPHVTRDTHVGLVVCGCPCGWLGYWVHCLALGLACPSTVREVRGEREEGGRGNKHNKAHLIDTTGGETRQ
jgi:hypothetical protein